MGLFSSTPEELAEKERYKAEKERYKEEQARQMAELALLASPQGQARLAKQAGQKIFQVEIPLSTTTGSTVAMVGTLTTSSPTKDCSGMIQAIESEGWRLEHVGYVYRVTGSVSRDKFLASGQQEAVNGEIIGIYLFRAGE